MRPLAVAAVLLAGSLLAAPVPKDKKVKDEEGIVGVWKVEAFDDGGAHLVPKDKIAKTRFYFDEQGKFAFESHTPLEFFGTFKLDAKTKAFDLIYGEQTTPCLYELDDDTLKLCWPYCGKVRPTEFKADGEKGVGVWTLKRVTDEKNVLKKEK